MISKEYIIAAAEGIHARPAAALVKLAKQFASAITLRYGEKSVKINSVLNILTLGAKGKESITVVIDGPDEERAAEELDKFFEAL